MCTGLPEHVRFETLRSLSRAFGRLADIELFGQALPRLQHKWSRLSHR
ncbi:hypothetical protein BN8_00856 [Fibrisoma limi BUZ 3]|uniref:Uncharacterized protein n=1 Tax=Fibrisoma limi BUZ 3 TaxID=1185876 RepID=I2GDC4_9BACT|nr:hypothetical protein BN8_00856 [Fibrisoma limi BUZ 3]